ncbi:RICIN domain-containing protein [Halosimplex sp. TS25]|uniref:RICIN domain-containing protein n=1 Tax=Halosimplex rarum TaxID=3396619 RepID=UPI0039E78BAD
MTDNTMQDACGGEQTLRTSRRSVLRAAGAGVGALALGSLSGTAAAAPSRLHTEGKWIRDADGNDVKLRGIAMADAGFYERFHPKSSMDVAEWATDADRGWHPNLLRIPCTQDSISHYGAANYVQNYVRPIVDLCADRGIYAMVDLHLVRPYTEQATDDSDTTYDKYPDEVVRNFWNEAAPAFADDSHVLFELFNEPTEPAYWDDDQQAWSTWKGVAQPWVDRVRELASETPIVIGSPRWTSVPDAAPDDPFSGNDLIYSGHIYPSNGQPSDFDGTYGAPASEVPIFITEFGWDPDGDANVDQGTTSGWGEPFRNWVEGYENMGWAAWCFDDSWAPTFFSSPDAGANEPWTLKDGDEQAGGYIKTWLDETVNGSGGDDGGGGDDGSDGDSGGLADGTYQVANVNSGQAMDVSGGDTGDGGNVLQWPYGGAENQQWTVTQNGDGTYTFEAVHSGKVLEVANAETGDGANVQQWTDSGGDHQRFELIDQGNGEYRVQPVHSGMAVGVADAATSDGANVEQQSWSDGAHQRWTFSSV